MAQNIQLNNRPRKNMLCVVIFQRQHDYKTQTDGKTIALDEESC